MELPSLHKERKQNKYINKKFGRLFVLDALRRDGRSWLTCVCDCGTKKDIAMSSVQSGNSLSCGCIQREVASARFKTHGLSRTKEYRCWAHMIRRCTDSSSRMFKYYGARGITVCEEWMVFENFLRHVGHAPTVNHTLDRRDNDKGYEPSNCRWVTMAVQSVNKRSNVYYDFDGHKLTLPEISKRSNIHVATLAARIKNGLTVEQAISKPRKMHATTFINR